VTDAKRRARQERLERLHQDNAADVLSFLGRRVTTPADAADALSETFIAAWRHIDRMPADPVQARMWLFGVARRVASNARRSSDRRDALTARLGEHLETLQPTQTDDTTESVLAAISELPRNQAELIKLVLWDGFTVVEAASIVGVRESTARGRYQRARLHLRQLLRDPGEQDVRVRVPLEKSAAHVDH